MLKKGISPLISTVIIIGIAVGITAAIIGWGTAFFKEKTQSEELAARARVACTQMGFTIDSVCVGPAPSTEIVMDIRSLKETEIAGFVFTSTDLFGKTFKDFTPLKGFKTTTIRVDPGKTITTLDIVPQSALGTDYEPCEIAIKTVKTTRECTP